MTLLICGTYKENDTNELIYKTERLIDLENKFMVARGRDS